MRRCSLLQPADNYLHDHYRPVPACRVSQAVKSSTVMGLLEEARLSRSRGFKAAQQAGSVQTLLGRLKDWFMGNF